ncbi:MAG: hypothetical protein EP343_01085 [Deltaproteobacteria bacterium]|nr:MAG: hypothetical protein EP343_01085 [Deltaproteobacteria bacterium]
MIQTDRVGADVSSTTNATREALWNPLLVCVDLRALALGVWLVMTAMSWGCGNNLTPCETTTDCQRNGSSKVCINKSCYSQCDQRCVKDSECGSCGDSGVYRCRNGSCKPLASVGTESKVYEQCGESIQKDCPQDTLCQKPSADASFGYCYPQCSTAQSPSCNDDKGTCTAFLEGDLCLPKGTATKHAPCGLAKDAPSIDLNRLCAPTFSCIRFTAENPNGFCLPLCNPQQPSCDNGQGRCQLLSDNSGVCIPNPQGKEGNTCDTLETLKTLDPARLCQAQFYCANGKCNARQEKGVYEKCDDTTTCGSKALCVTLQRGVNYGYCVALCNEAGQACENQTGTCLRLGNGQGACIPGSGDEGAACGENNGPEKLDPGKYCKNGLTCNSGKCEKLPEYGVDEVCSNQRPCKSGLQCIAFSQPGTAGLCLPTVSQCDANACDEGRVCLTGASGGICARACSTADDCPSPSDCKELSNGTEKVMVCTTP